MQNTPYWLDPNFICPVKIQTYKMLENFLKDSPLFLFVICYDSVVAFVVSTFAFMNMPHFPIQDVLNIMALILGGLRIYPAFMASLKAYRDRKRPEEGKEN